MVRNYETLLLLSPELGEENRKELIDGLLAIIEREQGKLVEVDDWGVRTLAYPVNKLTMRT